MSKKIYLSKEKKKELEDELKVGIDIKRKEIAELLEFAKSLGDLSENAEYHQAREAQAELEDRIAEIEDILKHAVVVSGVLEKGVVSLGSTITLKKGGETKERVYKIVGSEESNIALGKVSNTSPFGMALLGKKVGEKASVDAPGGKVNYTIVEIK